MISIKFYDNGGKTVDRYTVVFDVFGVDFVYAMSAEPSHAQGGCSELFACKPDSAWLRRAGKPLRGNKLVPAGVRAMAAELLRQELEGVL